MNYSADILVLDSYASFHIIHWFTITNKVWDFILEFVDVKVKKIMAIISENDFDIFKILLPL